MQTMWQDVRYSARMILRNPGITLVIALSIGLGVGINTTVFTWMESLILNPYPVVTEAERVVALNTVEFGSVGAGTRPISYPTYLDLRDRTQSFDGLGVHVSRRFNLRRLNSEDNGEAVWGQLVSGNYFEVLRVRAAQGRTFLATEEKQVAPVAVISDKLWQQKFARDKSIVGQQILLNGTEVTIVGVGPPKFSGTIVGLAFDIWAPVTLQPQLLPGRNDINARGDKWLQGLGRMKAGVSLDQARAEVITISEQISRDLGESPALGINVNRLRDQFAGRLLTPLLSILLVITGIVLLTACANVANLLLARATSRQKEISIRLALGAGRARIVRQLLIDSLLLSALGGLVGLFVAFRARDVFHLLMPPVAQPVSITIAFNGRVIGFALLLTFVTALVFGLIPALRASKPELVSVLKEGERGFSRGRSRLQSGLVVAQVAFSLVALVSAGLFLRSMRSAQTMALGFGDPSKVLVVSTDLNLAKLDQARGVAAIEQLQERVRTLPGVSSVSLTSMIPLGFGGHSYSGTEVEGYTPAPNEEITVERVIVSRDYFETMQIPVIAGRGITAHDRPAGLRVAVINEAFVRRYWPNQEVIGKRVNQGAGWATVIGVAKDSVVRDLGEDPPPVVYSALAQRFTSSLFLQVRTGQDPKLLTEAVRREFTAVNRDLPFLDPRTMSESLTASSFVQFIGATMLSAFGLLALSLSSIGLYGVLAFVITQRRREIAIRIALGAQSNDVRRLIFKQGFTLVLIGLAVGSVATFGVTRLLRSQLLGVSPYDPLTFLAGALLLSLVALVACYIPARRATKVDPLVALRYE